MQALNDLFEKILQRDVPARYLLRLGMGEQELATTLDFSRVGRVNAMLARRLELLAEVLSWQSRAGALISKPAKVAQEREHPLQSVSPLLVAHHTVYSVLPRAQVEQMAKQLGVADNVSYTCETAAHFWLLHVLAPWEKFMAAVKARRTPDSVKVCHGL